MINAYKSSFKGYVDFAGRSTRSEYWWVWLGNMILYIPFFFAYGNAISNPQDEGALIGLGGTAIIYMVIGLALLLPSLCFDGPSPSRRWFPLGTYLYFIRSTG